MSSWGDSTIAKESRRSEVRPTPPHSPEAEQSVLGAILTDNTALPLVVDLVDTQSFYLGEHQAIFAAMQAMHRAGEPVDPITVFDHLQSREMDDAAGGLKYLVDLQGSVASARNVRRYAEIVARHYADRQLLVACDEAQRIGADAEMPLPQRLERIASALARVERLGNGVGGRLPLMRLDALDAAFAAVRWIVKHVIPADSIGMLFGASGTFKSFVAVDLALHVAHGLPWMGRLTRQSTVLYIAAEGKAGLAARVRAWHKKRNLSREKIQESFAVLPMAIDLSVDAWRVVEVVQSFGMAPGLVIIDTLSQTYSGEENSANEMASYFREIGLRFRELWGAALLVVHHSGHTATERPRGSSAIEANVDFLISAWRDVDELMTTVACCKQKDGEKFPDASFGVEVVDLGLDEDGDKITSLVARHLSSKDEVERARLAEQAAGRGGRTSSLIGLVQNGMDERELRKAFYELLEGLDSEAKKKAYQRARATAMASGYFEIVAGVIVLNGAVQ